MFRKFLQRRRIQKVFENYVSKETLAALLAGKLDPQVGQLKEATVEVVIATVRGESPETIKQRMGTLADIALKHGAVVQNLISSVVIITFGALPFAHNPSGDRFVVAQEFVQALKDDVKVVHCKRDGKFGNVGGPHLLSYSFIIPGFLEMLGVLAAMNFGETRDVSDI